MMPSTLRRLLTLSVALAAMAVASGAGPAEAGTAQAVCIPALSATASGDVYGAGSCSGGGVSVYRRPASGITFRSTGVLWRGYDAVDVADDGASTFVLMHCQDVAGTCPGADPLVGGFAVAKLPHGGRPSAVTYLGDGQAGSGTIAASGGRWVAAFAAQEFRRSDTDRAYSRIELRGTAVGGGGRAILRPDNPDATPEPYVTDPAVGLTPYGPVFAYLAKHRDTDPAPELRTAAVDVGGRISTTTFAPAAGAPAGAPALAISGGRTFIAWPRNGRLALAHDGVRHDLPTRGTVADVALAASGGRTFVLDQERFAYAGSTTGRVYLRSVTVDGTATTTELSAAAGRRDAHVQAGLNDVTAARGRATSSFYDGTQNLVVTP